MLEQLMTPVERYSGEPELMPVILIYFCM